MFTVVLLLFSACAPEISSSDPVLDRIHSALLARQYFTPAQAEITDVMFYCVCGPYTSCAEESKKAADELRYERPPYNFRFLAEQQKILFFRSGEIIEIEIPHSRLRIADEHEAFCGTDMDLKVPRSWIGGRAMKTEGAPTRTAELADPSPGALRAPPSPSRGEDGTEFAVRAGGETS
jgi:hypothetical protein